MWRMHRRHAIDPCWFFPVDPFFRPSDMQHCFMIQHRIYWQLRKQTVVVGCRNKAVICKKERMVRCRLTHKRGLGYDIEPYSDYAFTASFEFVSNGKLYSVSDSLL